MGLIRIVPFGSWVKFFGSDISGQVDFSTSSTGAFGLNPIKNGGYGDGQTIVHYYLSNNFSIFYQMGIATIARAENFNTSM